MSKRYYTKHRSKVLARTKAWYKANRRRVLAKGVRDRACVRAEVLKIYGGKCVCCGENESRFLTIDLTRNDGAKHRAQTKQNNIYFWLKRNNYPSEGFQVLCANCNFAKEFCRICPHKTKKRKI